MSEQPEKAGPDNPFLLESQQDGSKIPVEGDIKVGRDPACELVLNCDRCSRVHALFALDDGALWVEDRASTNGTFVNKQQISERTRLQDGDMVQFGDSRFRVIAPAPTTTDDDNPATVKASRESLLRMLEGADKAVEAAKSLSSSDPGQATRTASADSEPGSDSEIKAPVRKKGGKMPSIPHSWADADRLEQASHTSVFVRGSKDGDNSGTGVLHPLEAIAQARLNTPAHMAIFVGLKKPVQGKLFELDTAEGAKKWEIGRGAKADIDIDDVSVSGRHAQVIHEKGRWKIVNMMSVNGTFVNDRKVLSAYLNARDVIRVGAVELVFDARIKGAKGPAPSSQKGGFWSWLRRLFGRRKRQ